MSELQYLFLLKQKFNAPESNALIRTICIERASDLLAKPLPDSLRNAVVLFISQGQHVVKEERERFEQQQRHERNERLVKLRHRLELWSKSPPLQVVVPLVACSAWWYAHASGPVRAPKHAERVRASEGGWRVRFGANSFLVSEYIIRTSRYLASKCDDIESGRVKFFPKNDIIETLKMLASECVANYNDDRYEFYYPKDVWLIFGAQAINVSDAAEYIYNNSGFRPFTFRLS